MKVLFDHHSPFLLAHGGFQIQIEQTKASLQDIGVEVEHLRWWDDTQRGEILHFFGRPTRGYIQFAHQKGLKVVVEELHSGLGSRGPRARLVQKALIGFCRHALPGAFLEKLAWDAYQLADAFVVNTTWEAELIRTMFAAAPAKTHVIPNGVEETFFASPKVERGPWLVTSGTITERKRMVELATAAIAAETPLWVIGKPYGESDPYYAQFLALARQHPRFIRYEGSISDRAALAQIYRSARGFVLWSTMETLSLSTDEAAACECPLLLSDLPWAHSAFGSTATYLSPFLPIPEAARALRAFYDRAPQTPPGRRPPLWSDVARQFAAMYTSVLASS